MAAPPRVDDRQLRFRFDSTDDRRWPLHSITTEHHQRLLKRLKYFERLTLRQARSNNVLGDYDMSECPNHVARRVLQNEHGGLDSLTKLVVEPSGPLRLFGIREGNEIHVLWWDAEHEIWPESKIVR